MTTKVDLKAYVGKKIKFNYTPPKNAADESSRTIEGTIDMATDSALLIKERGSAMLKLVEMSGVDESSIEFIVDPPRELKQKTVDPVTVSSVRNHLLDKHGFSLKKINAMSDQEAFDKHAEIDWHDDMGHVHEVRN